MERWGGARGAGGALGVEAQSRSAAREGRLEAALLEGGSRLLGNGLPEPREQGREQGSVFLTSGPSEGKAPATPAGPTERPAEGRRGAGRAALEACEWGAGQWDDWGAACPRLRGHGDLPGAPGERRGHDCQRRWREPGRLWPSRRGRAPVPLDGWAQRWTQRTSAEEVRRAEGRGAGRAACATAAPGTAAA